MRILLLPLAWLYGVLMAVRNLAFDLGVLRRARAGVPVISVGNLTAGGTGKTPLVELIAGMLIGRGLKVAVVSRGYGRRSKGVVVVSDNGVVLADAGTGGDEPVQIARKFSRASVVVGERRSAAAEVAVRQCGAEVIVLDDGFQHRYLERDLDIVVLDARKGISRERLLPAGKRREWVAGLRRAGLIGFSHAEGGIDSPPPGRKDAGMFTYRTMIRGFARVADGVAVDSGSLEKKALFAFSGIGDPDSFRESLRSCGVAVVGTMRFSDHHRYSRDDLEVILLGAAAAGADMCVTTEKDMVRLIADPGIVACLRIPTVYAVAGVDLLEGADLLDSALTRVLERAQ